MIVDELIAILGYETRGEGELKRFKRSIDDTAKGIGVLGVAAGAFVGTLAAGAFARLTESISSLPGDIVKVSAQFEGFHSSLETITGSTKAADDAMAWISKFAQTTPYEVAGVTDAFVKLKTYGIDPIANDTLRTLGDAASAMNKPLNQAVEALADATTFQFERLKEFGLTTQQKGDQVTFSWIENGKQLSKTVKKNAEDVRKFVLDQLGGRFNGAMIRQSKTWNGMVSNLADSWTNFQLRIGKSGFFDAIKTKLADVLDYIGRLDASGALDRWATAIGNGLTKAVDGVIYGLDRLRRHFQFLTSWISINPDTFKAIAIGLGLIAAVKFPFLTGLAILEDILTWMEGGKSIIGEFADALAKLAGIDAGTLGAIFATLAGAVGLAAAASSIGLMTAALNPLTASLLAFAGAFALAKAGFEYFDKLKSEADAKIEATKATDNPRARPGYVEPVGADIARDANGNAIVDANGQPVVKRYGPALNMRGAAVVDQPRPANLENSMTQGALDWKTMMENAEGNALKMRDGAPTNAVVNDNKQDNRNQSVTVQVGGVTVQGVQNVSPAVGAAVGNAVGNSAASAVPRASRFEKDDAF